MNHKKQQLSPEKQSIIDAAFSEWKGHPYTNQFLKDLMAERQSLLEKAENLSLNTTVSIEQIISVLAQSRKLRDIIDYVTKTSSNSIGT